MNIKRYILNEFEKYQDEMTLRQFLVNNENILYEYKSNPDIEILEYINILCDNDLFYECSSLDYEMSFLMDYCIQHETYYQDNYRDVYNLALINQKLCRFLMASDKIIFDESNIKHMRIVPKYCIIHDIINACTTDYADKFMVKLYEISRNNEELQNWIFTNYSYLFWS